MNGKYIIILILLIFHSILGKARKRGLKDFEKVPWSIIASNDTLHLYCCSWLVNRNELVLNDTIETRIKSIVFYRGYLSSMKRVGYDDNCSKMIKFYNAFPYKFQTLFGNDYLIIYDYPLNKIYFYQVLGLYQTDEILRLDLLKPEGEKLLSDLDYIHPKFPLKGVNCNKE